MVIQLEFKFAEYLPELLLSFWFHKFYNVKFKMNKLICKNKKFKNSKLCKFKKIRKNHNTKLLSLDKWPPNLLNKSFSSLFTFSSTSSYFYLVSSSSSILLISCWFLEVTSRAFRSDVSLYWSRLFSRTRTSCFISSYSSRAFYATAWYFLFYCSSSSIFCLMNDFSSVCFS